MTEWRDISTAPSRGFFLVAMQYRGGKWVAVAAAKSTVPLWPTLTGTMTHWMPLPEPPK